MRKLHVVGFTSELDGLIFSTRRGAKTGSYVVPISDELYDKLAEAERLRNGGELSPAAPGRWLPGGEEPEARRPRPESSLTPREIQARLRAGRTIDEVAKEAGVDREWVERFAAPILAEQAQVVDLARTLTFSKPRLGESAEPLGASVAANLADRGVRVLEDEFDAGWSAYQLHDGVWMVRFRYRSRGRAQQASWELDLGTGRLVSRDRLGSDLGYVERGRKRRSAGRLSELLEETAEPPDEAVPPVREAGAGRGRASAASAGASAAGERTARRTPAAPRGGAKKPPAKAAKAAKARKGAKTKAAEGKAAEGKATRRSGSGQRRASSPAASEGERKFGTDGTRLPGVGRRPSSTSARAGSTTAGQRTSAAAAAASAASRERRVTQGTSGVRGRNAEPGPRGRNAEPGRRGPNAEPGRRGPNAEPGRRGRNAEPGRRGPNAEPGLRGPNAEPGLRGRNAEPGLRGSASSRGTPPRNTAPSRTAGPGRNASSRRATSPSKAAGSSAGRAGAPVGSRAAAPAPAPAAAPSERTRGEGFGPGDNGSGGRRPPPRNPSESAGRRLDALAERLATARADVASRARSAAGSRRERDEEEERPGGEHGSGSAIAIGPPPEEARNHDRGATEDDGAFVIRPRISARQASELAFSDDRPRRLRPPFASTAMF